MEDFIMQVGKYFYVIDKDTLEIKERTSSLGSITFFMPLPKKVGDSIFIYQTDNTNLKVWFNGYTYHIDLENNSNGVYSELYINNSFCLRGFFMHIGLHVCRIDDALFIRIFGKNLLIRDNSIFVLSVDHNDENITSILKDGTLGGINFGCYTIRGRAYGLEMNLRDFKRRMIFEV